MPSSDDPTERNSTTGSDQRGAADWRPAPDPSRAAHGPSDGAAEVSGPLKREGDALLDGSGSRQGLDPDPARDAAPHE
jgi:hypothetical protein